MTPKSAPAAPSGSSVQWLSLLVIGALAVAGWVQSWKWQQIAKSTREQKNDTAEQTAMDLNPTLSLMQDVDLIRQNELLSDENKRLSRELKQLQEEADKVRERAALDGSGGILR